MRKNINPTPPKDLTDSPPSTQPTLTSVLIKDVSSVLLSLTLFVGGIVLLALRIPFWGLFLGLPATQIGIVFAIFAFDRISQSSLELNRLHEAKCSICKKPTLALDGVSPPVCLDCQRKKKI